MNKNNIESKSYKNLINKVLQNSEDKYSLNNAFTEWKVIQVHHLEGDDPTICICNTENFKRVYTIQNIINNNILYPIGRVCIKKFNNSDMIEQMKILDLVKCEICNKELSFTFYDKHVSSKIHQKNVLKKRLEEERKQLEEERKRLKEQLEQERIRNIIWIEKKCNNCSNIFRISNEYDYLDLCKKCRPEKIEKICENCNKKIYILKKYENIKYCFDCRDEIRKICIVCKENFYPKNIKYKKCFKCSH